MKVVWVPPEYGDAVACICADGTMSLWEEVVEGIFLVYYLVWPSVMSIMIHAMVMCWIYH